MSLTDIEALAQWDFPIWGGPAHGQVWRATTDHIIAVPIHRPLSLSLADDLDPTVPAIDQAEYQIAKFIWTWRDGWRTGRMFLPMNPAYDTPAVIEVESVLQFLGRLWGAQSE